MEKTRNFSHAFPKYTVHQTIVCDINSLLCSYLSGLAFWFYNVKMETKTVPRCDEGTLASKRRSLIYDKEARFEAREVYVYVTSVHMMLVNVILKSQYAYTSMLTERCDYK